MGLMERVSTLVRANLNDLLERAEDPEKTIKQILIDMSSQLIQVRTQVAAAIADERKLKKLWQENQTIAVEWQRKAEIAVDRTDDDLARQALARRNSYTELTDGFRKQFEEHTTRVTALKDALQELEAKIQEAQADDGRPERSPGHLRVPANGAQHRRAGVPGRGYQRA